jgi:hypothetical protein
MDADRKLYTFFLGNLYIVLSNEKVLCLLKTKFWKEADHFLFLSYIERDTKPGSRVSLTNGKRQEGDSCRST